MGYVHRYLHYSKCDRWEGMIGIRCLHIRKIERKEDKYTGEQVLLGMIVRSGNLHGYTRG